MCLRTQRDSGEHVSPPALTWESNSHAHYLKNAIIKAGVKLTKVIASFSMGSSKKQKKCSLVSALLGWEVHGLCWVANSHDRCRVAAVAYKYVISAKKLQYTPLRSPALLRFHEETKLTTSTTTFRAMALE